MIDTWVELPEKLKSHDDDRAEHLRCGRDWCGMSMQKNGKYCMHKGHRSYKYMVQRRVGVVVVPVEENSGVCKEAECRSRNA
jgi:hypothetical protein